MKAKKAYRPRQSIRPMLNTPVKGKTREAERMVNHISARLDAAHEANEMLLDWVYRGDRVRSDYRANVGRLVDRLPPPRADHRATDTQKSKAAKA
jgi:hypothetical protein